MLQYMACIPQLCMRICMHACIVVLLLVHPQNRIQTTLSKHGSQYAYIHTKAATKVQSFATTFEASLKSFGNCFHLKLHSVIC